MYCELIQQRIVTQVHTSLIENMVWVHNVVMMIMIVHYTRLVSFVIVGKCDGIQMVRMRWTNNGIDTVTTSNSIYNSSEE